MEQKTKFIIIGLIGILVISLFVAIQTFNAKQAVERERDALRAKNDSLVGEVNARLQESQRLQERLDLIKQDVDRISQEKDEVQNNYSLVVRERDVLLEKIKTVQAAPTERQPAATVAPLGGDDTYWARVLKERTDLEFQISNIRNELKSLQIKNEEAQRDKNSLELEVKNYLRDEEDLQRQLEYNKKVTDSLTQELVVEKNDKFQIQNSFKTIRGENLTLRRQLRSLNNRKIALETKLIELQSKNAGLDKSFGEMETILKDKMAQIDNLRTQLDIVKKTGLVPQQKEEESVELPPIVVRPQQETSATETGALNLQGKILAVKRDNNFVIIDLGDEAGIRVGDSFQVYRGGKNIANIEAVQVRKNISACDIKQESTPIKIGDTVR